MQTLSHVTHEHHEYLRQDLVQLRELATCLDSDCLDRAELEARLPRLAAVHEGLTHHLLPHMDAVEAAVHPTLERLAADYGTTTTMAEEHEQIRRLLQQLGDFIADPAAHEDRSSVLLLRRIVLRLFTLVTTHLTEEELYLPILEGRLRPAQEAALARALDHLASERL